MNFNAKSNSDKRGKLYKEDTNYPRSDQGQFGGVINIENAGINSKYSDYSTIVHNNKIYCLPQQEIQGTSSSTQTQMDWSVFPPNLYVAGCGFG